MKVIENPNRSKICGKNLKKHIKASVHIRTQERFAELMEVNVRTVKRWVAEGVDSLTTIKQIADLLGISDLELLME